MASGSFGCLRTDAEWLYQGIRGKDPVRREGPALNAQGQGGARYIKDGAREETLGLPGSWQFRSSDQYPEIPSASDPEGRPRLLPVLLLASHLRYTVCGERDGSTHAS